MRPIPLIGILLILSALVPGVLAGEAYVFVTAWGSRGEGDGQFNYPTGLSIDDPLYVYVADSENHRIQKFAQSGTFIRSFGSWGFSEGRMYRPRDVATDSAGNVYVADTLNYRIQKFTSTGTFLATWGEYGSGDGQFWSLYAVAVDGDGNVYATDINNDRVMKFTSTGAFITEWGEYGDGEGQFFDPHGIAIDGTGNVYIVDSNNDRIQKFTSSGTYLASWGSRGSGDGQFFQPFDVAVDDEGNVFVTDYQNHRVQKFTSGGTFVTKWGSEGAGEGQFDHPEGIAVDADGDVYVGDLCNHRIQKFRRTSLTVTSPAGESWVPTRTYPITWTQEGLSGTDVRIELWRVGASVPERTIAASTHAVSGTYSWTIPADLEPGTGYRVRVVSLLPNGPDDYSGPLTITPPPVLNVTSPEGGESWATGRTVPITWTQEGLSGTNVKVELYTGGMGLAKVGTIAAVWPASAGTYSWTIPADLEPGTRYLVKVTSLLSGGPEDYAGFVTLVSSPALTVTSPESGDSWIAGTVHPVTWTQEGLSGTNVKVELYTGGMGLAPVGTIASSWPASAGTYSWKIPWDQEPGTRYLVKVTSLLSGGPEDYSGSLAIMHLTPTPTPRPFPNSGLPLDLDKDGRYEDVNGNNRKDFADVVLYFNQMTWIETNEPLAAFDYNGNQRIDFADVTWLFNNL